MFQSENLQGLLIFISWELFCSPANHNNPLMSNVRREKERQEEGKNEWRRLSEKEREVLGPHHRSPTHIPSTSTSLHYLHVNDSSLCPAEGRKRPINTTAEKARALFSLRRVVLLHPHTPTHLHTHAYTHSWPEEERWTRTWAMQWEGCSWRVSNLQLKSRKQDKIAHRAWIGGGTWASTCAACLVVKLGNKPTVWGFFWPLLKHSP